MTTAPTGPRKRKFTVEDYHRMGRMGLFEADERTELLDGEIFYMTPIGSRHAGHVAHLSKLFERSAGDELLVWTQNPIRLGDHSEPEPDITLLADREDRYAGRLPGPEDVHLVVEVAESSADFDRSRKIPLYARHGIPVAWLVDLTESAVEIHRDPGDDTYRDVRTAEDDDSVCLETFDVDFQVEELFLD